MEAAIRLRRTRTCAAAILLLLLFWDPRAFAACTAPAGNAGDSNYNQQWRTVQYCNGASWSSTGRPQYAAQGAYFDGVNIYLNSGNNVANLPTDNGIVSGSFWFRRTTKFGTQQNIFRANSGTTYTNAKTRFLIELNTSNQLHFQAGSTTTAILDVTTGTTFTDTNWHHVMYSMNLASGHNIYVDGVADTSTWNTYTSANINLKTITTPNWSVGATPTGTLKFTGSLADFWFVSGTYIDLSVAANRRLFYNGGPVYLGATGSLPTGTSPPIFFSGPWASWNNLGTGGSFSLPTAPINGGDTSLTGNLNAGLIGWWKMDEGTGTTTADSAGGSTGTFVNGPTWATGKYSNALTFNRASNSSVNMGNVTGINGLSAITVSAWVKSSSSGGNATESHWVDKSDCGGNFGGGPFELLNHIGLTDLPAFAVYPYGAGGTFTDAVGTTSVDDATWHMVTGEWDSSIQTVSIWVDGIMQTSFQTAGAGPLNTTTLALDIGGYCNNPAGSGLEWNGLIDDVRIYNRALNWGDVLALYNQTGCASPTGGAGDILYNATSHVPQYCDGAAWQAMGKVPGAGGAGCASPSGTEGDVVYNADKGYMQYCDGTHWIGMGASNYGPQAGLVGWWKLDETSGTSAADSSGTGNTGTTHSGPTWITTGQVNGALHFTVNQTVTVANSASLDLSGNWTVSGWVNLTTLPGSGDSLLAKTDSTTNQNYSFAVDNAECGANNGTSEDAVLGFRNSSGTLFYVCASNDIQAGTWYLITGTWNSSTKLLSLYVNGVLAASGTQAGATPVSGSGGTLTFGDTSLAGSLDDLRIYNRLFSATEVKQLYTATGGHL